MKWRIRDIIDLEYFLYKDGISQSSEEEQLLFQRDRKIYLNSVMPRVKEGETPKRQFIIQTWLDRRREKEAAGKNTVFPGESYENLYSSFRIFFVLAGFVIGAAAGLSFLIYTGNRPLNVFVYLAVFVVSQILFLLLMVVLSLIRLKKRSFLSASPLYKVISKNMLRILLSVRKQVSEKMTADQRNRMGSVQGIIMSRCRSYGFLFVVPVFILTQLFGIGLNMGLLAATLFKIVTADVAFGWQSTLQLSPDAVHSMVQNIAIPWSWLVADGLAFPSLAQIEGSRIILKEGIYHLSTPDLVSWWPFLCLSVLFYGLFPRFFLFVGAVAVQRKLFWALDFKQGVYEQLLLRMTTPRVTTHGRTSETPADDTKETEKDNSGIEEADQDQINKDQLDQDQTAKDETITGKSLLVMIPDDIFDACSREEVASIVKNRFVAAVQEVIRINEDYETDLEILSSLKSRDWIAQSGVLVIHEAWQPPIMEYITFIKNLRQAIGVEPSIRIGLIGKPLTNTIFTQVKDENRKIWDQKITAIGDPSIFTMRLVNNAS